MKPQKRDYLLPSIDEVKDPRLVQLSDVFPPNRVQENSDDAKAEKAWKEWFNGIVFMLLFFFITVWFVTDRWYVLVLAALFTPLILIFTWLQLHGVDQQGRKNKNKD